MKSYWDLLPREIREYILTIRDLPEIKAKKELLCSHINTKQHALYYPTDEKILKYFERSRGIYIDIPDRCDFYLVSRFQDFTSSSYHRVLTILANNPKLQSIYCDINALIIKSPCSLKTQDTKNRDEYTIIRINNSNIKFSWMYKIQSARLCYKCYQYTKVILEQL